MNRRQTTFTKGFLVTSMFSSIACSLNMLDNFSMLQLFDVFHALRSSISIGPACLQTGNALSFADLNAYVLAQVTHPIDNGQLASDLASGARQPIHSKAEHRYVIPFSSRFFSIWLIVMRSLCSSSVFFLLVRKPHHSIHGRTRSLSNTSPVAAQITSIGPNHIVSIFRTAIGVCTILLTSAASSCAYTVHVKSQSTLQRRF